MKLSRTFSYGDHDVTIETGAVARQADGAVIVTMAESELSLMVLVKVDSSFRSCDVDV